MALIKPADKEYFDLYRGFDTVNVGPGTDPDMYASDAYAKSKTKELYLGSLAEAYYAGFEHDASPLMLTLRHVTRYNVILGINVNYLPVRLRLAVLKYVLESNKNRIRDGLPIMVDWNALKRAVPAVAGATRMYKLPLLRVTELYPLVEWEEAAKTSGSRWSNHYKKFI